MIIQLVPSDTKVAQLPITPKMIAVPAVVLPIGTTLLDAEFTNCGCIFFTVIYRPVQLEAAGSVSVMAEPLLLLMIQESVPVIV